jgi:UTP:GlnB (protein PII) uridylyltransferase
MGMAKERDVSNLRNWLSSTGCIAREERKYLCLEADLMALSSQTVDGALRGLQDSVEDLLKFLWGWSKRWDKLVRTVTQ